MGELERVLKEMERMVHEHQARVTTKKLFKQQVAATDRLLDLLEGMNLREVKFVGAPAAQHIQQTLAVVPPCMRPRVAPTTPVQGALDRVFELQKALFVNHARRGRR